MGHNKTGCAKTVGFQCRCFADVSLVTNLQTSCSKQRFFKNYGVSAQTKDVEAVEYFFLLLPAPYKVSHFWVCFRFQLLSSKCFRKNLTTSTSTSLLHVLWKMLPLLKKLNASEFASFIKMLLLPQKFNHFRFHIPGTDKTGSGNPDILWTREREGHFFRILCRCRLLIVPIQQSCNFMGEGRYYVFG